MINGRSAGRLAVCRRTIGGGASVGRILQIGIAINAHLSRSLESIEIRRDIDIEKLSVDEEKSLGVGEAAKTRKIFGLDFLNARGANLRHARGFFERDFFRETARCNFWPRGSMGAADQTVASRSTRISRGFAPSPGPNMPRCSRISTIRAARV